MPLHPALVHLPLAIAVLLPALAVSGVVSLARTGSRVVWRAVVGAQALLVAAALAALVSGQGDQGAVARVVGAAAVDAHETAADAFFAAAVASFFVGGVALIAREPRAARGAAALATALAVVTAALAVRVGHLGGELVYVHGAARAHGAPR